MSATKVFNRSRKVTVSILSSNRRLQLRFSYGGERYYISTGYPDEPEYRQLADIKAKEVEKDILYERFDPNSLEKYKSLNANFQVAPSADLAAEQPNLAEVWSKYETFKRPSASPSTIAKDYTRTARCIANYSNPI